MHNHKLKMAYSSNENIIPTSKEWSKWGDEIWFNSKKNYIIDLNTITTIDIITEENKKQVAGTFAGAAAGMLLLGPLGAIGGLLLGGNKKLVNIAVALNNGNSFVATCTTKTHLDLLQYAGRGGTPISQEPKAVKRKSIAVKKKPEKIINDTKECPVCAETIKVKAKMCRYCRHEFTDEEVQKSIESISPKIRTKKDKPGKTKAKTTKKQPTIKQVVDNLRQMPEVEMVKVYFDLTEDDMDTPLRTILEPNADKYLLQSLNASPDSFEDQLWFYEHFENKVDGKKFPLFRIFKKEFGTGSYFMALMNVIEGVDDILSLTPNILSSHIKNIFKTIRNSSSDKTKSKDLLTKYLLRMTLYDTYWEDATRDVTLPKETDTLLSYGMKKASLFSFGGKDEKQEEWMMQLDNYVKIDWFDAKDSVSKVLKEKGGEATILDVWYELNSSTGMNPKYKY